MTAWIKQIVTAQKIKGNFGNGSKEQQAQAVAFFVSGVLITLGNQETENRKCKAADFSQDLVQIDYLTADAEWSDQYVTKWIKYHSGMVDDHGDDGDHLESSAT